MNNFAIIIKSHKRANTQLTLEELKKMNYKGNLFIIVDDEDPQLNEYKENYGNIIKVFNKDEMLKYADTLDNFNNKNNALLPAIYAKKLAENLKLDYYFLMDDDIFSIRERYEENNQLKGRNINNINAIIEVFINYMKKTNISCLSFGNEGGYIGGINGKFKNGIGRNNNQNFLIKTKDNINFLGTRNEDFNMIANYSKIGKIIFEIYRIGIRSPERGTNSGGLKDDYETSGFYVANFYSIIIAPYCCKLGYRNDKIILKRDWKNFGPMIISEVYKK